jgi:hypothetical protein
LLQSLLVIIEHCELEISLLRVQLPRIQERGDAARLVTLNNGFELPIETLQQVQVFSDSLLSVWGRPVLRVDDAMGVKDLMLRKTGPELSNE